MPDDAIERARQALLAQLPASPQWAEVRAAIADGSIRIHSDPMSRLAVGAIDALLLAFASQQAPEGWMLIDTAPKDGEPILIWKPDERMVGEYMMAAYWTDDHHSGEPGFVPVGGHHKLGYLSRVTGTPQGYPTHWQPLPAPPTMLDAAPSVTLGEVG